MVTPVYILDFSEISIKDMSDGRRQERFSGPPFSMSCARLGINLLDGFATTAAAYRRLLDEEGLAWSLSHVPKRLLLE